MPSCVTVIYTEESLTKRLSVDLNTTVGELRELISRELPVHLSEKWNTDGVVLQPSGIIIPSESSPFSESKFDDDNRKLRSLCKPNDLIISIVPCTSMPGRGSLQPRRALQFELQQPLNKNYATDLALPVTSDKGTLLLEARLKSFEAKLRAEREARAADKREQEARLKSLEAERKAEREAREAEREAGKREQEARLKSFEAEREARKASKREQEARLKSFEAEIREASERNLKAAREADKREREEEREAAEEKLRRALTEEITTAFRNSHYFS